MQTWNIDTSHSSIRFAVRHLMFAKVHGAFKAFTGEVSFDDAKNDFSGVKATIQAGSVDTGEEKRDAHLKSPDFLDAEKWKTLGFESTKVEKAGDGYKVLGNLTIHGVTKPVTLDVESLGRAKDPWGGTRAAFVAKVHIDRKDFGLTWNQALDAGGVVVGDKVEIELEVQAVAPRA